MLATIMGTVGATISNFILTVLEQRHLLVNAQHTTTITTATVVTMIQLELFAQQQP